MTDLSEHLAGYGRQLEGAMTPLEIDEIVGAVRVPSAPRVPPGRGPRLAPAVAVAASLVAILVVAGVWWLVGRGQGGVADDGSTTTTTVLTGRSLIPTGLEVVALPRDRFTGWVADRSGALWAAGGGVTRFVPSTGETRVWTVADDLAFGRVWGIAPSPRGGVWLFGSMLARFDGSRLETEIPPPGDEVAALAESGDGTLWAVSADALGLYRLLRWSGDAWIDAGLDPQAVVDETYRVIEVIPDGGAGVWVPRGATGGEFGMATLWFDGGDWRAVETGIDPAAVAAIVPHPDGTVSILATSGRMVRGGPGRWTSYPAPDLVPGRVMTAVLDTDGTLWAGFCDELEAGMSMLSFDGTAWSIGPRLGRGCGDLVATGDGLYAGAVAAGGTDSLWILQGAQWVRLQMAASYPELPALSMSALSEDDMWMSDGERVWHFAHGVVDAFDGDSGLPGSVRHLVVDGTGTVWVATDHGAAYFDAPRWLVVDVRPAEAVIPHGDAVWIVLSGGHRTNPATRASVALAMRTGDGWVVGEPSLSPLVTVYSGQVAPDGSLWLAGTGAYTGLFRGGVARLRDGEWSDHDALRLPALDWIPEVGVDSRGMVWVTGTTLEAVSRRYLASFDGSGWTESTSPGSPGVVGIWPWWGLQRSATELYLMADDGVFVVGEAGWEPVNQGPLAAVPGLVVVAADDSLLKVTDLGVVVRAG